MQVYKTNIQQGVILGLLVSLIITLLSWCGIFEPFELKSLDYRFRLFSLNKPLDSRIKLILIDDYTFSQINQFPFPRDLQALLIHTLTKDEYRPKQIGFDILFSEKSPNPKYDDLLSDCTTLAKNVYHSYIFHFSTSEDVDEEVEQLLESSCIGGRMYSENLPASHIKTAVSFTSSLPCLLKGAKGIGHTNVFHDTDGVIRKIPLVIKYKDKLYPNLALLLACDYLNISQEDIEIIPGKYIILDRIKIPIDKQCQMLLNFTTSDLKTNSFIEVLQSAKQIEGREKPIISLKDYKDKVVLIGSIATGQGDICTTPISAQYPGVGIFATAIDNILNQQFLTRLSKGLNSILLIMIGLMIGLLLPRLTALKQGLFSLVFLCSYLSISIYLFRIHQLWLEQVAPGSVILFSHLAISLQSYAFEKTKLLSVIEDLRSKLEAIILKTTPIEPIKIDFRLKEIRIGDKSIKKDEPRFILLQHFIRKQILHWTSGYGIFDNWNIESPKDPAGAFRIQVTNLNEPFKRRIIESTRKGTLGKGYYQFKLKKDDYECNILEAEQIIKKANEDIDKNLPAQAEAKVKKAIELDPANIEGYWLLCKMNKGTITDYEDCFKLILAKIKSYMKSISYLDGKEWKEQYWTVIGIERDRLNKELEDLEKKKEEVEKRIKELKHEEETPEESTLITLLREIRESDDKSSLFDKLINMPFFKELIEEWTDKVMKFSKTKLDKKDPEGLVLSSLFMVIIEDEDTKIDIQLGDETSLTANIKDRLKRQIERQLEIEKSEGLSLDEERLDKAAMSQWRTKEDENQ
ncbi:MAG: CHASE2 domain-containing protein [bacterium]